MDTYAYIGIHKESTKNIPCTCPTGKLTALSVSATYQEILDDDIRKSTKRKAGEALCDIDLGPCRPKPPPTLHLGPILKKRFYGY